MIVCYLVLVHVALGGLIAAWATGAIKRPNPSHTLTWTTQTVAQSDLAGADLGSIMPGWDADALTHYVSSNGRRVLEITEFKSGVAIIGVSDDARGETWIFNRRPTIAGMAAPHVSMTRREVVTGAHGEATPGKRIESFMDQDGDGILELRLGTTADVNERVPRSRLKADAWEPWPWPEK